ncbi:glycosyltransferase family 2 protein, partial [Priestia megaterium]|uniref:glycosyltransferase family 2 protein n=1 Tax=Priestia megaterium TaxID=1404 RepID=UPI00300946EF
MPNFKKKISIVVPVYNASNTIERCVQSILSQTYTNIEIILVDDGSKDNSLEICKKLQSRDSRIVVVSRKNAGVSVARNKGIEMANGDYIAFVDSDDYVKPEMYEKLINIAESRKVSLVFCNYEEVTTSGDSRKVNQLSHINEGNNLSENIKVIEYMLQITNASIFGCCWRTLINVNLLTQNSIRFTPGITMAEDLKFILECLG